LVRKRLTSSRIAVTSSENSKFMRLYPNRL